MDDITKIIFGTVISSIMLIIGGFVKTIYGRVDHLEKQLPMKLDQQEVRQIVADKIDPMREDIHEIKAKLDRVMDILIDKKK